MEFILYNYFRSSASYRARIALHLKEIPFEYRAVHLLNNGGEQHASDYAKLNPGEEVPTLIHNGKTIAQSMAILDYLDQVKPTPRLFPQEAYKRALVIQACEIVNSGIQPLINLRILGDLEKNFGMNAEAKTAYFHRCFAHGLKVLETFLQNHAGQFSFGNEVTAADCFVIPQLTTADRMGFDTKPYPTLTRIRANCEKLEGFKKASPLVQPDTPA